MISILIYDFSRTYVSIGMYRRRKAQDAQA
jgi:hypothetical protein